MKMLQLTKSLDIARASSEFAWRALYSRRNRRSSLQVTLSYRRHCWNFVFVSDQFHGDIFHGANFHFPYTFHACKLRKTKTTETTREALVQKGNMPEREKRPKKADYLQNLTTAMEIVSHTVRKQRDFLQHQLKITFMEKFSRVLAIRRFHAHDFANKTPVFAQFFFVHRQCDAVDCREVHFFVISHNFLFGFWRNCFLLMFGWHSIATNKSRTSWKSRFVLVFILSNIFYLFADHSMR